MQLFHRGFARPEFIMTGNGAIALEDSLALLPWHLRVNLDVKETNPLV